MKPKTPQELLAKAKKVYQEPERKELPLPVGFPERVVSSLESDDKGKLVLLQRVSFAGVAVAAGVAVVVSLSPPEIGAATDPWMEMPMSAQFETP